MRKIIIKFKKKKFFDIYQHKRMFNSFYNLSSFASRWIFSTNHKDIGILYLIKSIYYFFSLFYVNSLFFRFFVIFCLYILFNNIVFEQFFSNCNPTKIKYVMDPTYEGMERMKHLLTIDDVVVEYEELRYREPVRNYDFKSIYVKHDAGISAYALNVEMKTFTCEFGSFTHANKQILPLNDYIVENHLKKLPYYNEGISKAWEANENAFVVCPQRLKTGILFRGTGMSSSNFSYKPLDVSDMITKNWNAN